MAALLSYKNYVTAAMLSSPTTWSSTLPLTRAATRQLSEYAQLASAGTSADIRVDLGASYTYPVAVAALLGVSPGEVVMRVTASIGSATGTDVYDQTLNLTAAAREGIDTPHLHLPIAGATNQARYWRFQLTFPSVAFKVGRVWLGPVFGGTIEDAPAIDALWSVGAVDPSQTSSSPGIQAYARDMTRVRELSMEYKELTRDQALGVAEVPVVDLEGIGRLIGSASPCLVCARNDSVHLRHRTLVYGAQLNPWRATHTGADRYDSGLLRFKGEN